MRRTSEALAGTRVILSGLGVGVRVGDEYVLFERTGGTEPAPDRPPPEQMYREAVEWLTGLGTAVLSPGRVRALADVNPGDYLDHVGFSTADLQAVIAALRAAGATPLSQTDERALYRAGKAGIVEIVRETDAPEMFWCPMHPDVRLPPGSSCPLCGMRLTPVPPPRAGDYRMDLSVTPGAAGGTWAFRIRMREPDGAAAVPAFTAVHEKPLHFFIISRDLDHFSHVHPVAAGDGVFDLTEAMPGGTYVVIADFLPQGGSSQLLQRAIVTPGYAGPLFPSIPNLVASDRAERIVDGIRVRLDASGLRAGRAAALRLWLSDAATGGAVDGLEPFLGAPAHMLIVNAALTETIHAHPEGTAPASGEPSRAPAVSFVPLMPSPGLYKLWVQFQRHGRVITVPFVVAVEAA